MADCCVNNHKIISHHTQFVYHNMLRYTAWDAGCTLMVQYLG